MGGTDGGGWNSVGCCEGHAGAGGDAVLTPTGKPVFKKKKLKRKKKRLNSLALSISPSVLLAAGLAIPWLLIIFD